MLRFISTECRGVKMMKRHLIIFFGVMKPPVMHFTQHVAEAFLCMDVTLKSV